jgi:hypothetical protein
MKKKSHGAAPVSRRRFIAQTTAAAAMSAVAASSSRAATAGNAALGRIDCQSHLFCREVVTLMEKRKTDPRVYTKDGVQVIQMGDWLRKIPPHYFDVDVKLQAMDAAGISLTALSINDPGPEWFGATARGRADLNDFVAGIVRKHPTRFFGLCVLPLQDMKASLSELDRCVQQLGMKASCSTRISRENSRRAGVSAAFRAGGRARHPGAAASREADHARFREGVRDDEHARQHVRQHDCAHAAADVRASSTSFPS